MKKIFNLIETYGYLTVGLMGWFFIVCAILVG